MIKNKKILPLLLLLSLSLVACGQDGVDEATTVESSQLDVSSLARREEEIVKREAEIEKKEMLQKKEESISQRESELEKKEQKSSLENSATHLESANTKEVQIVQEENSSTTLENYDSLEIEYARVLLMTDGVDSNSPVIYVAHTPAGTPIADYYSSDSAEYPNVVTHLFGEFGASGSITYSSNGDGTITIYPVPSHWHQEDQSPEGYRELTQEIVDTAQTVYVDPGNAIDVINKIESVEFVYQ